MIISPMCRDYQTISHGPCFRGRRMPRLSEENEALRLRAAKAILQVLMSRLGGKSVWEGLRYDDKCKCSQKMWYHVIYVFNIIYVLNNYMLQDKKYSIFEDSIIDRWFAFMICFFSPHLFIPFSYFAGRLEALNFRVHRQTPRFPCWFGTFGAQDWSNRIADPCCLDGVFFKSASW